VPLFDYTGQLQNGAAFQGTLEAESREHAEATLADMGIRVLSLHPARRAGFVSPLSLEDFQFFNEQLAALTKTGIPLQDGLRQLAADVGSRRLKRLLLDLADDLASGTPLEQAIAKLEQRFPTHYASVIQAGLKTGDLSGMLYGLASHLRLKSTTRHALIEIAAYPVAILAVALAVLSLVMRVVVPQFESLISELYVQAPAPALGYVPGATPPQPSLPLTTRLVLAASDVWPIVETLVILLLVLVIALLATIGLPIGVAWRERLLRFIPGINRIYWSSVLARFTHTSALGAFSGKPLPELVQAGGASSGSPALSKATQRVSRKLQEGRTLTDAVEGERDIPALWTCVVSATAMRGDLPAALSELARTYEAQAQHWVRTMRVILGPLLLLLVGTLLALIFVGLAGALADLIASLTGGR
jgi:type II secretory pathway component PulF